MEANILKKKYTFRGGTHVDEHKVTATCPIEVMPAPDTVSIPLSQHIGAPCQPLVKVGDTVLRGQIIGDVVNGALGCPVHSSVSGTVTAIDSRNNAQGVAISNIIIKNDGNNTPSPDIVPPSKHYTEMTPDEMVEVIRKAGISGMGGAMFPTYAKVKSAIGKATHMVINCAECEPFITADHRMMLERAYSIIGGIRILLHALSIKECIIATEDNKSDAAAELEEAIGNSSDIRVCLCKTKYPQGDERQLMYALFGKELPAGKLPADIGCVLFNCSTCAAVFNAFEYGLPVVERVVTVTGDCVADPKNVLAPIGASFLDLINFCGGLVKTPEKLVSGGPMMGAAQWDINAPVTKGTSAIITFSREACPQHDVASVCIRCGRCVKNCPMHLMPNYLVQYAMAYNYDECAKLGVMSCVECGTCSFNCPGRMMIVQHIRVAKGALRARK